MLTDVVGKATLVAAVLLGAAAGGRAEAPGDPLKDRVHVFAVNGLDPFCWGNLNGLCDRLREQGYCHTHFGRLITSHGFADQIRKVRAADPDARVVLIGFSYGCSSAQAIANALAEEDVRVDLLVYIAGDLIRDEPRSRPANVGRVVNIRAHGMAVLGGDLFYNQDDITGGYNIRLACRHFAAPSRWETLDVVLSELAALTPGPPCRD